MIECRKLTRAVGLSLGVSVLLAASSPSTTVAQRGSGRGVVAGQISLDGGRPDETVAVYLEAEDETLDPVALDTVPEVRQRGRRFHPAVLIVPVGTTIRFPNDDRIFHNVFSLSRTRRFDLGLYRSGASRDVRFTREGVVDIYCNIHPEMSAHVLVVNTRYFSQVDRDGRFRITGVEPGTYRVVAWQRYGATDRRTVTVQAGSTTQLDIEMTAGRRPRTHPNKDGRPYGRYR